MKKTKIMIFEKHNTKQPKPNFFIGNSLVTHAKGYNYLGIKLTPTANFKLANEQLSEKALNSLNKIRKYLKLHLLSPKSACKIFDSMVSPILLYNSEVWGAYTNCDFNKWDNTSTEKVHLKFCKLYLGVNRRASNLASRAELGKFPLLIPIYKRIINYITHIIELPDTSIVKQAFSLSKELFKNGKPSFYSNVTKILKPLCPPLFRNSDNLETFINNCKQYNALELIKEKYISSWRQKMANSTKLSFYNSIKKDYKIEKHLYIIKNFTQRRMFTQFRISNHKLEIENGRYKNIPRDQRLCEYCDSSEVEEEYHFALQCQNYKTTRDNSNPILKTIFQESLTIETKKKLFEQMISSSDQVVIFLMSEFITKSFQKREIQESRIDDRVKS